MTTTGDPGSGYVLRPGAGWTYARHGFTVKARERDATNGAAVFEFLAPVGQDPPTHVHPTEDEMFYVLGGSFTFQCGGNSFEAERRSFIFLPRGVPRRSTAHDGDRGRLLAITSPPREAPDTWRGFEASFEESGTLTEDG